MAMMRTERRPRKVRWGGRAEAGALVVTAAVMMAAAGCGPGPRPGQEAVPPASYAIPGVTGRRCEYTNRDGPLPALDDLARPGTAGSIALLTRGATDADTVVLSIRYGEEGQLDWVRALSFTAPPETVAELTRMLQQALTERWHQDSGVRLRVVAGRVDAVLPSVVCEAYPIRRTLGQPQTLITAQEYYEYSQVRGRRFDVLVTLDERGRVLDVRLPNPTGYHTVDQYLVEYPRDWEYEPRLHDGIPVPTTVRLSVRVGGY